MARAEDKCLVLDAMKVNGIKPACFAVVSAFHPVVTVASIVPAVRNGFLDASLLLEVATSYCVVRRKII
jgi:hypothetical protein